MTEPESTTTRRDLLGILLSRVERGVITDQERPLLRPLVEAEMAPDAAMLEAKAEYDELQQRHDDLIAETRRQGDVHERTAQRAKQAEVELAAAQAVNVEAWQLIEMMKDLIGAERRIVINAMDHRETAGGTSEHCDHCGRDHLAELDEAIRSADKRYGEAFPATHDGPARPGRLPTPTPTPTPAAASVQDGEAGL